jgi:cytochrome P450
MLHVSRELFRDYGDLVGIRLLPRDWGPFVYILNRPEHAKHVLNDNHKNYWKGLLAGRLGIVVGQGLLLSEGEQWRRQRRLAQPAFHRQRLEDLVGLMTTSIAPMLERWEAAVAAGAPVDMAAEMRPLTIAIIWSAMVGTVPESAALVDSGLRLAEFIRDRVMRLVPTPAWLPTRANRRFRDALRFVDGLIHRTIAERRQQTHHGDDLLGLLLAATDPESGASMSDRQVRDELMTILTAAEDATAVALAWCWWTLARHPEAEANVREEVDRVLGGRVPTAADVASLPYVRRVVQETLRLYPPAWAMIRQAIAEDEIGGQRIRARSTVVLCTYMIHRHPEFWDDPETFDPERFRPEAIAARPRHAFLPFGAGPRVCIGLEMAMLQAVLTVAMVCQRYRFRLVPGRPVEPWVQTLLRPRSGVWMTLTDAGGRDLRSRVPPDGRTALSSTSVR